MPTQQETEAPFDTEEKGALIVKDAMAEAIIYPVDDAKIAELKEKYLPLKVEGPNDDAGFALVHDARMVVKNLRVSIEKRRVDLKAGALEFGKKVDGEAKRLTKAIAPVEEHLEAQEQIVKAEKDRQKREAEAKRARELEERLQALRECECMANPALIAEMDDEQFGAYLTKAVEAHHAKKQAAEAEAARLKQQEDRIAADKEELRLAREQHEKMQRDQQAALEKQRAEQQAELDRQKAEQAAAQKKIDDERAALAKAESDRLAAIELERATKAAAEQARLEQIAKEKRERQEAIERMEAEEAARKRAEELRPAKEKLIALADSLRTMAIPEIEPTVDESVRSILIMAADAIRNIATHGLK